MTVLLAVIGDQIIFWSLTFAFYMIGVFPRAKSTPGDGETQHNKRHNGDDE
jgi:hypothetical protein